MRAQGLEIPNPTKEIQGLIRATFSQCEKDKPIVKPVEDTDRAECEAFALGVFRRADRVDRAGRADANTSKAFYAAAIFMQVLEQFLDKGEEMEVAAPDILEKIRYALWRAAEIRRATREGRLPAPPPDAGNGGGAAVPSDLTGSSAFDALPPVVPGAPPPMDSTVMREVEDEEAGEDGAPLSAPADELLALLPRPPSTVPPEGSTGLVVPAAAAGPRFQQGARVWCAPGTGSSGGGAAGGAVPELGTVGMMAAADGGPGGQAMYKARTGAGKEGKGIRGAFGEDGKSQV
jgi:vacuolar protein sorting-associated protein VTA1